MLLISASFFFFFSCSHLYYYRPLFVLVMPPKAKLGTAPVYGMAHEEQVRLLSDALLREYMHRKGFLQTLKKFDEEHPRDADTVSSRAVMCDLMALTSSDQQRLKSEGTETVMEMLCSMRTERRQLTEELEAQKHMPIPEVPEECLQIIAKQEEQKVMKKKVQEKVSKESLAEMQEGGGTDSTSTRLKSTRLLETLPDTFSTPMNKKKTVKSGKVSTDLRTDTSSVAFPHTKTSLRNVFSPPLSHSVLKKEIPLTVEKEMTLDELLDSNTKGEDIQQSKYPVDYHVSQSSHFVSKEKKRSGLGHSRAIEEQNMRDEELVPTSQLAVKSDEGDEQKQWGTLKDVEGRNSVMSIEQYKVEKVGENYDETCTAGVPCSPMDLEKAFFVLCGDQQLAPPLSFLQQGFELAEPPGVRLIQWAKGPSAVIAATQAFVSAFYFEHAAPIDSKELQLRSLVKALLHILQSAQPALEKIVVVDGLLRLQAPPQHFLQQLGTQYHQWSSFCSFHELEDRIEKLIESHWRRSKGSGLWCFLLSLVLSRGISVIKADGGSLPLIHSRIGTGNSSLLHLCLCGVSKDALAPSLSSRFLFHCGLLEGDYKGSSATESSALRTNSLAQLVKGGNEIDSTKREEKNGPEEENETFSSGTRLQPVLPSWVIAHGEHYCNVYMKKDTRKIFEQKRALGGSASSALTFWDALTGEDEITLEVKVPTAGAWEEGLRRRATTDSFVERAIFTVPQWRTALVDWNGRVAVV